MVTDAVGLMLLEQNMAQAHHAHLAVAVRVAGKDAHVLVVARHAVLQDQVIGITARIHIANYLLKLRAIGNLVGLLLPLELVLPPHDAVGRLQDHREGEVDLVEHLGGRLALSVEHRHGKGERMRIGHAVLLAQLVEDFLLLALLEHLVGRIGRNDVRGKLAGVLSLRGKRYIVVAAAHKDNLLIGIGLRDTVDGLDHDRHGIDIHVRRVVDDLAAIRRAGLVLAKDEALDLILLIEGTRHRIGVDVAAEQHGDKLALCKLQCHGNLPI